MSTSMTQPKAPPKTDNPDIAATLDPARASLQGGEYDHERGMTRWLLRYAGTEETHTVTGWSDGTEARCSCPGFRFSRRSPAQCRHTLAFGLLLEAVGRERQEARTTRELQADEAWFGRQESYSPDERRALNAIRETLRARGAWRTPVERRAVAARAAGAKVVLFTEE